MLIAQDYLRDGREKIKGLQGIARGLVVGVIGEEGVRKGGGGVAEGAVGVVRGCVDGG